MSAADTLRVLYDHARAGRVANYDGMLRAAAELDYLAEQVEALRGENDELRAGVAAMDSAAATADQDADGM